MLNFKDKMTPAELAALTGYTPQTINKWARRFGWASSRLPGVKGGKAQVIHITAEVREFLNHTGRMQKNSPPVLYESAPHYASTPFVQLENQLLSALTQLTERERNALLALLLREGIAGLLSRLGIRPD